MSALRFSFSGLRVTRRRRVLLRDESLSLGDGETHVVCGANGAGKTTLLRVLAGLEKPDCATVTVGARTDGWRKQKKRLRQAAAYLHQFPYMLEGSVEKNLAYPLSRRGIGGPRKRALIAEAAALAGLEGLLPAHAKTLSGGEQQRVALARAWLRRPRVMLLDEPTANMDRPARRRATQLLARLARQGMAIVVASHDPEQFADNGHVLWHLRDGRLAPTSPARLEAAATVAPVHAA